MTENYSKMGSRMRAGALKWALCVGALAILAGCSHSDKTGQSQSPAIPLPPPTTNAPANQPAASNFSSVPGHMDIGSGTSLTPTPDLDSKIAQLAKSGGSKKELSLLYTKRGMERMMDAQASPHVKYPAALQDFRKAAKLDPTNDQAVNSKKLIESIYISMGRPIPGG